MKNWTKIMRKIARAARKNMENCRKNHGFPRKSAKCAYKESNPVP